jgi:hypothetical protein
MVRDLLGEPDHRGANPHNLYGPAMRLYNLDRVLLVESTAQWSIRQAQARLRTAAAQRAVETRRRRREAKACPTPLSLNAT